MFLQAALETMFSPMARRLLGFTSVENSITYVCIGVIAVAGYARKVSNHDLNLGYGDERRPRIIVQG